MQLQLPLVLRPECPLSIVPVYPGGQVGGGAQLSFLSLVIVGTLEKGEETRTGLSQQTPGTFWVAEKKVLPRYREPCLPGSFLGGLMNKVLSA